MVILSVTGWNWAPVANKTSCKSVADFVRKQSKSPFPVGQLKFEAISLIWLLSGHIGCAAKILSAYRVSKNCKTTYYQRFA